MIPNMEFTGKQSLTDYPEKERTAYLAAVASVATPEDKATTEEEEFLTDLCEEAELSPPNRDHVLLEAQNPGSDNFEYYLDWLKQSELKYSFMVDVISFARTDGDYGEVEKQKILNVAKRLGINQAQYQALYEYVVQAEAAKEDEGIQKSFLERTGLAQRFRSLNIPIQGLLSGLLGSLLINGFLAHNLRKSGLLNKFLGAKRYQKGGISSLVGLLSGPRGFPRTGSLLGRI